MTAPGSEGTTSAGLNPLGTYAIEFEGVSLRYGGSTVVYNLSMHVPPGSIYGLVGPSGAGKSTAMRILVTLQNPDTGTVFVDGFEVRANPAAVRARIGYLPDFSGLYEGLTLAEYLNFYAAIYQVPPHRRRQTTDELLELVGLTARRDAPVKALSRGMRQKLALARCLVHDPHILVLDEPASGIDPRSRLDLRDILIELARLGKTILVSSHLLSELAEVCSHLGIMRTGELIAEGTMEEIMRAVSPDTRVCVHLLRPDDTDTARQILGTYPAHCEVESRDSSTLAVRFEGKRQDLADMLGLLSTSGVEVTEFSVERPTLEEVFAQIIDTGAQA